VPHSPSRVNLGLTGEPGATIKEEVEDLPTESEN